MEFRHPYFRPTFCNTSWNEYREIEDVTVDDTERGATTQNDENGNYRNESTIEHTTERNQRITETPQRRVRITEIAPLVLSESD